MKNVVFLTILLLIIGSGIFWYLTKGNSDDIAWINPDVRCGLSNQEKAVKQYPYEADLSDKEREENIGENKLNEFCSNIRKRFGNSNMSPDDADLIYKLILNEGVISDESYGMPSPDEPKLSKLTIEDIKKRMAVKKINDNSYEIFYYDIGCGTNFNYLELTIRDNALIDRKEIERWSGSSPC